ncbi:MAG: hypothetical protein A3H57_03110 [Candidatus Taylorbacteria bacterium RIFCSPLOWO2_02_FULL_43_11]|uniref:Uncharacterized protein n=1 Tax=Candidatus Taylorbacteria bacterium RIFCSPHIGHO2_02_FULL_43_32b TaxID=1802306 RepID=A0A1G2MLY9_9BACT|nr:MAG: hypothetical protein A2743_03205 [Candidatus Taylorbacteria bacterium RIFCSPHIGHO2_01_FULL_43_47]OHA24754.1 MAG: hypothetical protein A3C72_00770 [Candidatus Taylorbacteria bacterium RIFCSPHIGHO2_02_FULL_43_32b]OHA31680.1 MAG: hypothetical protein A3B08_00115 [Candidatus Taylorbacteria bacterium RIFCSPLOWO2_01_FULL_43_44]OHA35393.1 MAG: hypothetical protein A3H57_03110 [Candidatus Taylorbacteria bacterium RIFCSPLOWO2_02_FULL_43_11]
MTKSTILSIIVAVGIIGLALWFSGSSGKGGAEVGALNTTINGDKQYIDIVAKGGYSPKVINAKAGIPLVVKMNTANTFDCSAFVVIPSINYRGTLQKDGTTEIPIPAQPAGTTLRGSCGMGMYGFAINFI